MARSVHKNRGWPFPQDLDKYHPHTKIHSDIKDNAYFAANTRIPLIFLVSRCMWPTSVKDCCTMNLVASTRRIREHKGGGAYIF